ncbi:MAG: phage major capsid protein [Roseibium sp.]|nr:phage major capsid protein [Roseibium sp.]
MTELEKLRAALAKAVEEMGKFKAGIVDDDGNPRDLNEDEQKSYRELIDVAKRAEAAYDTEVEADALRSRNLKGADDKPTTKSTSTPAEPAPRMSTVERAGLVAMSIAASQFELRDTGEMVSPLKMLDEHGFGDFAKTVERERTARRELLKTLNASTAVSGGLLTPDAMENDIIELLYPETTFLQGGPRQVNMPNGTWSQPAGASGATASYRTEGNAIETTEPSFRKVQMSAKFLGAIVPMTRQMLDFSVPGARAFVEGDLRETMSQTMDQKAYFGDGEEGDPLGMFNYDGISTVVVEGATAPTLVQIDNTFKKLRLSLLNKNIRNMGRWAYVMSPRTLEYLQNIRVGDNDGQYAYPETRGETPKMSKIPILDSTQFPINLGVGGDESLIALVNFADILMGTQAALAFAASTEATIKINGTVVSAFQNDLVFIRATSAHDFGNRRPESIVYCPAVRWGA